jgi:hypothetical protein
MLNGTPVATAVADQRSAAGDGPPMDGDVVDAASAVVVP